MMSCNGLAAPVCGDQGSDAAAKGEMLRTEKHSVKSICPARFIVFKQ
jgi:hypothetical protein